MPDGGLGPRSPILSALFSGRYRHHSFLARSGGGSDADQHQTAGRDSRNRGLAEAEAWGQGGGQRAKKGRKGGKQRAKKARANLLKIRASARVAAANLLKIGASLPNF